MSARALIAIPAGAVAAGAVIATAHGLHEVALAATVPDPIAWVYPAITDGLAVVAYAAAHHVPDHKRYSWSVVLLASAMSGIAQAAYLAGGAHDAPPWLRFAIGAWPAAAALLVGHLLYLLWQAWKAADVARRAEEAAARAEEAAARVRALEEARAERERAEREREQDDQPDAQVVVMAKRRPQQPPPRRPRASADESARAAERVAELSKDQQVRERVRELSAQGRGRTTVMREYDLSEHHARQLLQAVQDGDRESVNA